MNTIIIFNTLFLVSIFFFLVVRACVLYMLNDRSKKLVHELKINIINKLSYATFVIILNCNSCNMTITFIVIIIIFIVHRTAHNRSQFIISSASLRYKIQSDFLFVVCVCYIIHLFGHCGVVWHVSSSFTLCVCVCVRAHRAIKVVFFMPRASLSLMTKFTKYTYNGMYKYTLKCLIRLDIVAQKKNG